MNKLTKEILATSAIRRRREPEAEDAAPPPYHPNDAGAAHSSGLSSGWGAGAALSTTTSNTNSAGTRTTTSNATSTHASSDTKVAPGSTPSVAGDGFACLLLGNSDRVTALGLPVSVVTPLGDAIARGWPSGVQRGGEVTDVSGGGWEWKLRGLPWREHIPARRLLCHLLTALYAAGWAVQATSNLSKGVLAKDTLFLTSVIPQVRTFFAISFNDQDRMRLIDPPADEVRSAFVRVGRTWHRGIHELKEKDNTTVDLRLRRFPFHTHSKTEQARVRALMLDLVRAFDHLGYQLVCCVEMPTMPTDAGDEPETWFFASKVPVSGSG